MYTREIQKKNGRKWETTSTNTNKEHILEALTQELIAKKINQCTWITTIKRRNCFDGTQEITVTYDNGYRSIYLIENH